MVFTCVCLQSQFALCSVYIYIISLLQPFKILNRIKRQCEDLQHFEHLSFQQVLKAYMIYHLGTN